MMRVGVDLLTIRYVKDERRFAKRCLTPGV